MNKNINLEIVESNAYLFDTKKNIEQFNINIDKNKLLYNTEYNTLIQYKSEYENLILQYNEYNKSDNNCIEVILPKNNEYFNKKLKGESMLDNIFWIDFQKNDVLYSGIKLINEYTYIVEHDLSLFWRAKGELNKTHGLIYKNGKNVNNNKFNGIETDGHMDWKQVDLLKNTIFSFIFNKNIEYQLKVNYSPNIYNSKMFLQDFEKNNNLLKKKIITKQILLEKYKLLVNLEQEKMDKLKNQKKNIKYDSYLISMNRTITEKIKIFKEKKLLINEQIDLGKAIYILKDITKEKNDIKSIINDFPDDIYSVKNIDKDLNNEKKSIIMNINKNKILLKKNVNDLNYILLSTKKYNDDIKSVLINNWKRDIDNFIIEFKKNSNNYINQYEKFIYDIVKKPLGDIQNIKLKDIDLSEDINKINKLYDNVNNIFNNANTYVNLHIRKNNIINKKINNDMGEINILFANVKSKKVIFDEKIYNFKAELNRSIHRTIEDEQTNIDININEIDGLFNDISNNYNSLNNTKDAYDINYANTIVNIQTIINNNNDLESSMENNFDNLLINNDYIEERESIQNNILTINTTLNNISNNILTDDINASINLFNNNNDLIKEKMQIIESVVENSLFSETTNYYNNNVENINNINQYLSDISQNLINLNDDYNIENNIEELNTFLETSLNVNIAINTYINLLKYENEYNKVKLNDNSINEYAVDIINYINLPNINFFEKYVQTQNKYDLIKNLSNILNEDFNKLKTLLIDTIDEINCIKNNFNKITYLLSKVVNIQTKNSNLDIDIKTTKKTIDQIAGLMVEQENKKQSLESSGPVDFDNVSFNLDPIVVENSNQQFFRNIKTRSTINTILPDITTSTINSPNSILEYVIRYIYWDESLIISNIDHSPQNETLNYSNNDIGMLGMKYYIKNNKPYIEFFKLFETPPYEIKESLNIGYYYNDIQGVWNLQNETLLDGNSKGYYWLKIWEKKLNLMYGSNNNDLVWYKMYENNYPENIREGNVNSKTTVFDLFGHQINNMGKNGPKQLALRSHAGLLGWLGANQKTYIEQLIDNKLLLNIERKINTPTDFDYTNCEGMYVLLNNPLYDEWDNVIQGYTFNAEQKNMSFFVVQNNTDSQFIFYEGMKSNLNFNTTYLDSSRISKTLTYIDFINDTEIDPLKKTDGSYVSNDNNIKLYKLSEANVDGQYSMNMQNTNGVNIECIISPYILEKNKAHIIPQYDTLEQNIYKFQDNYVLYSIHNIGDDNTFLGKTITFEIRKINLNTWEMDPFTTQRFLYKKIIGFGVEDTSGKYYLVINNETNDIDYDNYFEINEDKQNIFSDNIDTNISQNNARDIEIKQTIKTNSTIFTNVYQLKNIVDERNAILQIYDDTKLEETNILLNDYTIDDKTYPILKMEINNDIIKLYNIDTQFYDIGELLKVYTYIGKLNYWKYYETVNNSFQLFDNEYDNPRQLKTYKIRIESYEPFPLEIVNVDVFASENFTEKYDPVGNLIKYDIMYSNSEYKFGMAHQSSTSTYDNNANMAVNGANDDDNFSQTKIDFTNELKWWEVELNPPSLITSIHFYSRRNNSVINRIDNTQIFLIDENNNKINWKWRQVDSIPNSEEYLPGFEINNNEQGVWKEGVSATIVGDSRYMHRPQIFARIKTDQPFDYYSQNYIVKSNTSMIIRNDMDNINLNIDDLPLWDPIYFEKQTEKAIYESTFLNKLITYGFYIISDDNNIVNDTYNNTIGIESLKLNNEYIICIYSLNENYEKKNKTFNYVYSGDTNTYYLNGNRASELFIRKDGDEDDAKQIIQYNLGYGSTFTQLTLSQEFINGKIKEIENNQIIINEKKIENGEYLFIDESAPNYSYYKLIVNNPHINMIPLTDDLNINNGKSIEIKYLNFNFQNDNFNDISFNVYDVDAYLIPDKYINIEISNTNVKIILDKEQKISGFQIKKVNDDDIIGVDVSFYSTNDEIIYHKYVNYDTIYKTSNYINIRNDKQNIELINYIENENDYITMFLIFDENVLEYIPDSGNPIGSSVLKIQYSKIITPNIINVLYDDDLQTSVQLFEFHTKKEELDIIINTLNKTSRAYFTGAENTSYLITPIDDGISNYYTNSIGIFKLITTPDNSLLTYRLSNDYETIGENYEKKYNWNSETELYEDGDEYITELHEPNDYLTDIWEIIIGKKNNINIVKKFNVRLFAPAYQQKQLEILMHQQELEKRKISKTLNYNEYFIDYLNTIDTSNVYLISKIENDIVKINLFETLINKGDDLFKSIKIDTFIKEYHLILVNSTFLYIEYDTINNLYLYDNAINLINGNVVSFSNNQPTVLKLWKYEQEIINEKYENEYITKNNAENELKMQLLKTKVDETNLSLMHTIGGDIFIDGEWSYLFNTYDDVIGFKNSININLNNITNIELFQITEQILKFNAKKNPDGVGYASKSPIRFDDINTYNLIEVKNITDIDSMNFIFNESNSLHFQDYKTKMNEIRKEADFVFLDIYDELYTLFNRATQIKFYIEYKSNLLLMNYIRSQNNKTQWTDAIIPYRALQLNNLQQLISTYESNIINYYNIDNNTSIDQLIYDNETLNNAYLLHQVNFGTFNLREKVKRYMAVVFEYQKYINTYNKLKEFGPSIGKDVDSKWTFALFDEQYNLLPENIDTFSYQSNINNMPENIYSGIDEQILFSLKFTRNGEILKKDDPYNNIFIDEVNRLRNDSTLVESYANKIYEFYYNIYNIRKWQNIISNKILLNKLSQQNKIWNSNNELVYDISLIEQDIKSVNLFTEKKWIIKDVNIINSSFITHEVNHGSKIIRDNIEYFYNRLKLLYDKITTLQQSTPINVAADLNRGTSTQKYIGCLNEELFEVCVNSNNGEILMRKINTNLSYIDDNVSVYTWSFINHTYTNGNDTIKIQSVDIYYNYRLMWNNNSFYLSIWPTFYNFGDFNNFDLNLNESEKLEFYKANNPVNYSKFIWWNNQYTKGGDRNMSDILGTRLNSEFSVAKGAVRMPYLIYLRNDMLLPIRGYNKKNINDKIINITYKNGKGYEAFTKNELIEKKNNLIWWLNEWCKPLYFDKDEIVVSEDKSIDNEIPAVPQSKRWPVFYNTVQIFDTFIAEDSIMQWSTLLNNTGWSNEIKRNVTHKIIETALYPIMERITRHTKIFIEFCIILHELKLLREKYNAIVEKYTIVNDIQTDIEIVNNIKTEYPDIDSSLETIKKEFTDYYKSFEFQKIYKSIKKRTFNEDNTITYENNQGIIIEENIINFMSEISKDNQVFSEWKDYQEYGWKKYGHGSCGEWFVGAHDHPDITNRNDVYYNENLKNIFTNTDETFQYFKNILNCDFDFIDHLRAITTNYSNNYFFNDFKLCVGIVIKEQYTDLINIQTNEDQVNIIKRTKTTIINNTISNINTYVGREYNPINNIIENYKKNYLYRFGDVNESFYNNVKMLCNITNLPNEIVITIDRSYNDDDITNIMNATDIGTENDASYIAIFNGDVSDEDIINNNILPINHSNYITNYSKNVSYNSIICKEYNIPYGEFNNIINITHPIRIVFYLKYKGSDNTKIFAMTNSIALIDNNTKYNEKNIYLTYLNYVEKLKLLLQKSINVYNFINNLNEDNDEINTIMDFYLNKNSTEIPEEILKYETLYEDTYNNNITLTNNDIYSHTNWDIILNELNTLKNSILNNRNIESENISSWNNKINNYDKLFLDFNINLEKINDNLVEYDTNNNALFYYNNLKSNISLSNIIDNINNMTVYLDLYSTIVNQINNISISHDVAFIQREYNEITEKINNNIIKINLFVDKVDECLMFPQSNVYRMDNDMIYKDFWNNQKIIIKNIKNEYQKNLNSLTINLNALTTNNDKLILNKDKIFTIQTFTIIQKEDFELFKNIYMKLDFNAINITSSFSIINNLMVEFKEKYEELRIKSEEINNKTEDFVQGDLTIIQEKFVEVNNKNIYFKSLLDNYDNILNKYNKVLNSNNLFDFDIQLNSLENFINTTNIDNLNTYENLKMYTNKSIYYKFIYMTNNTIEIYNSLKTEYIFIDENIENILNMNININNKVSGYTNTIKNNHTEIYNNFNTIINEIKNEKNTNLIAHNLYNNNLKFKIYNHYDNTGNTLAIEIEGGNKIFNYDNNTNVYYEINNNSTMFYSIKNKCLNINGYTVILTKHEKSVNSNIISIVSEEEIIINNVNYDLIMVKIDNYKNNVLNTKRNIEEKKENINILVQESLEEKRKFDTYDWFTDMNDKFNISNEINTINQQVIYLNAYILELDLNIYLYSLFDSKIKKDIKKIEFLNNYTSIINKANEIENVNDNTSIENVNETILLYTNLNEEIQAPYTIGRTYTSFLNDIQKLDISYFNNITIDYETFISFMLKDNNNELIQINQIFQNTIIQKDEILSNKTNELNNKTNEVILFINNINNSLLGKNTLVADMVSNNDEYINKITGYINLYPISLLLNKLAEINDINSIILSTGVSSIITEKSKEKNELLIEYNSIEDAIDNNIIETNKLLNSINDNNNNIQIIIRDLNTDINTIEMKKQNIFNPGLMNDIIGGIKNNVSNLNDTKITNTLRSNDINLEISTYKDAYENL